MEGYGVNMTIGSDGFFGSMMVVTKSKADGGILRKDKADVVKKIRKKEVVLMLWDYGMDESNHLMN